jgi:ribonucleoside-diphosphate reductase alpha chain
MSEQYPLLTPDQISNKFWLDKYKSESDNSVDDSYLRVAKAAASVKVPKFLAPNQEKLEQTYYILLKSLQFMVGGRILANMGTTRTATTNFNCYVLPSVPDSIEGILNMAKDAALTQKAGGGVGFDFSIIRPAGAPVKGVESSASGPVSFMHIYDAVCKTIMSAGKRRGAQMGVLRIDHPDIEEFISAKTAEGKLNMFNLSVGITDEFMTAVEADAMFDLTFCGKTYKTVRARELWDKIMRNNYDYAEPGVIFLDQINRQNNLRYCETIHAVNPCGEQPLPPYGACLLGSLNLTMFVTLDLGVNWPALKAAVQVAVPLLDAVINKSAFPLKEQKHEAEQKRRIGLGVTGFADMLRMMQIPYGSDRAVETAEAIMQFIKITAYETSVQLAQEFGSFPLYDKEKFLASPFVRQLPRELFERIALHGIRNSHLLSIAPTGTMSLLLGNVSSGIEPVFANEYNRKFRKGAEDFEMFRLEDYAFYHFKKDNPCKDIPPWFDTTSDLIPIQHLRIMAAFQKHVDASISKTINVPASCSFEDFKGIYRTAYDLKLKGCTAFYEGGKLKGILTTGKPVEVPVPTPPPLLRPEILGGATYKIKDGQGLSYYITINNIDDNGVIRPYEIFINCKNLQQAAAMTTMTRLLSAVFRKERNPEFIVEELRSVVDPNGGYFVAGNGYVPSIQAHISHVIQKHLGIINPSKVIETKPVQVETTRRVDLCPKCAGNLQRSENCAKCPTCGWSKCD